MCELYVNLSKKYGEKKEKNGDRSSAMREYYEKMIGYLKGELV